MNLSTLNKSFTSSNSTTRRIARFGCFLPVVIASLLFAANEVHAAASTDDLNAVYNIDRVLRVEVTLSPEDWQELRITHRDFANPMVNPYKYYRATVAIDGETFENVAVRKKGLLGSMVSTRPSLKIKFDKYVDDLQFKGQPMLTLNNDNQDLTDAQQYMVYSFMRRSGALAPLCGLTHVIVNGEDLGVYTNVEPIRKPLLQRVLGNSNGDLYEGFGGDFTTDRMNRIQHKRGKDDDLSELRRFIDVLQDDETISLSEIEKHLDVDAFIKSWSSEVLIGHSNNYSGNRNNWYAYREPGSGRFYFFPWGADGAFRDPSPYFSYPVPKSVKALGAICQRLWEFPEIRERYRAEMLRLLNDVWNEEELLAELEKIQRLTSGIGKHDPEVLVSRTKEITDFIARRRTEVMEELADGTPDWPLPPAASGTPAPPQLPMTVAGSFSARMKHENPKRSIAKSVLNYWGDDPDSVVGQGSASLSYSIDGGEEISPFTRLGAVAFADRKGYRKGYPAVQIVAQSDSGHPLWNLRFTIDPYQIGKGTTTLPVDLFAVLANLSKGNADTPEFGNSWVRSGELTLKEFTMDEGGVVSGSFELNAVSFPAEE